MEDTLDDSQAEDETDDAPDDGTHADTMTGVGAFTVVIWIAFRVT